MDVKQRTENLVDSASLTKPSREEIENTRKQKKEKKKERVQLAQAKQRDEIIKRHRGEASGIYNQRDGVPYSSHLHPGTISFLKKFRPKVFAQMEADEKLLTKTHKDSNQSVIF